VGGAKNSSERLKILAESVSYDFSAENKQRMLNSSTLRFFVDKKCFFATFCEEDGEWCLETRFLPDFP
jgi:hypothetical protein